jgi:hypothetical protein
MRSMLVRNGGRPERRFFAGKGFFGYCQAFCPGLYAKIFGASFEIVGIRKLVVLNIVLDLLYYHHENKRTFPLHKVK